MASWRVRDRELINLLGHLADDLVPKAFGVVQVLAILGEVGAFRGRRAGRSLLLHGDPFVQHRAGLFGGTGHGW